MLQIEIDNESKFRNAEIHFVYGDDVVTITADLEYYQGCPDHNVPKFSGDAKLTLHGIADSGI